MVHASPVPLESRANRPAVPSTHDFQTQHLNVQKDKTLFWSGVPWKVVTQHAKDNELHTLGESWKDEHYPNNFEMKHEHDVHKFVKHASEALVRSASGKLHVMLPHDALDSGEPSSAWANHEWLHLKRPGVGVHRVDVNAKDGKW